MDRTHLNLAPALRLLLVGGLFAMFWIIFGASSAHAAPAPPPGESPHTATGLVSSLTAPVKPLITTVQLPTEPAPPTSTEPVPVPAAATAPPPGAAPNPSREPVTALRDVAAPNSDLTGNLAAPLTAPITDLAGGTVQPLVAPLTAPVTELAGGSVQPLIAPLTAPVTQLVRGTVQPLVAPITTLTGSALNPIVNPVDGLTRPLAGFISGSPAPTAASPIAPVTVNTSPGGDQATPPVETPRAAAALTAESSTSTTVLSHLFAGVTADSAPRAAASMNDGGTSPKSPTRLPSENLPATVPVPSPVSGSAGASGPAGAGAQAAADLSYRFVLPMTQGGEKSLFNFVLPGPTTRDPGFSPD